MKGTFQDKQSREDSIVVIVLSIAMLAIFPVAGFDYRFGWFILTGIGYRIGGWILLGISFLILIQVTRENTFLSRSIVVQEGRDQVVIDTGWYGLIRHPMYFSVVIMIIAIALILGSGMSFIPVILSIILLYVRAIYEEKLLDKQLEGYDQYTQKVRKRLIPLLL